MLPPGIVGWPPRFGPMSAVRRGYRRKQLFELMQRELAVAVAIDFLEPTREAHIVMLELVGAQRTVLVTVSAQHRIHGPRVERCRRLQSGRADRFVRTRPLPSLRRCRQYDRNR